ncbi:MAG: CPBP family intramembrane metalloprotease [Bacteroidota bacterium]|nr:CPBP family intramembrane metalloprotease [Bacteroidota bacterium]
MQYTLLSILPEDRNAILILVLTTASLGFIIWYYLASSLRLPVRYQIMYDANPPYVNRIFRRRVTGFLIYGAIPLFLLMCTKMFGKPSLVDLNISFQWNQEVMWYTLGGVLFVLLFSWRTTKQRSSLEQFPEVRIRFWRPSIFILSSLYWILYITAYEFFYRGLLFQSLLTAFNSEAVAVVGCTALYCLSHYFKLNRISIASIFYGAIACIVVLKTGSLIPTIVAHTASSLFVEWFSIRHHREMFILRT